MSSSCNSSIDCVEPVPATYVSLYGWLESDAEFVRSVTRRREAKSNGAHQDISTAVVDSYSCRQMYLRSYTFSRKESARERTRRCFVRVMEKVSLFAFLWRRRRRKKKKRVGGCRRSKRSKNSSTGCGCFVIGEIRKVYCAAFDRFHLSWSGVL